MTNLWGGQQRGGAGSGDIVVAGFRRESGDDGVDANRVIGLRPGLSSPSTLIRRWSKNATSSPSAWSASMASASRCPSVSRGGAVVGGGEDLGGAAAGLGLQQPGPHHLRR